MRREILLAACLLIIFLIIGRNSYRFKRWEALEPVAFTAVRAYQDWEKKHPNVPPSSDYEAQKLLQEALLKNATLFRYRGAGKPSPEFATYMESLISKLANRDTFLAEHGKEIDRLLR